MSLLKIKAMDINTTAGLLDYTKAKKTAGLVWDPLFHGRWKGMPRWGTGMKKALFGNNEPTFIGTGISGPETAYGSCIVLVCF